MKDITKFRNDGYQLLPAYFSEHIDNLDNITKLFIDMPEAKGKYMKYFETIETDGNSSRVLSRMEYLLDFNQDFQKLEELVIRPIAEYYLQSPVHLFKEKINFKLPGGGAFKPHQDFPAWDDFPLEEFITIGIPLDPMTLENGCLKMARGLGKSREIFHDEETKFIPQELSDSWDWTPILCGRGDILVFDAFVPHYSEINKTNNNRRIYYFTYNKTSEGEHRQDYFDRKREVFPQDVDKIPGKDYSKIGIKYNLGNPINTNIK